MQKWREFVAVGAGIVLVFAGGCLGEFQIPEIPMTEGLDLRSVSAGAFHACAVDNDGTVYCWGSNSSGQLGDGSATDKSGPSPVTGGSLRFSSVSAGGVHTCAITIARRAYCWGDNSSGQLGTGQLGSSALEPVQVLTDELLVRIAAGNGHTCAVTEDGAALCWGAQSAGQLGIGSSGPDPRTSPERVAGGLIVRTISAGAEHTCAVATDGAGYCWGAGNAGQLGTGMGSGAELPTLVAGGLLFDDIVAGVNHTCGVTPDLEVYCWGDGSSGQLGTGNLSSSQTPVRVPLEVSDAIEEGAVGAGGAYSCAAFGETMRCWGFNDAGQLGNGTTTSATSPVEVVGGRTFLAISTSLAPFSGFTCGITLEEIVFCWGAGSSGQLGNGSQQNQSGPVRVNGQN